MALQEPPLPDDLPDLEPIPVELPIDNLKSSGKPVWDERKTEDLIPGSGCKFRLVNAITRDKVHIIDGRIGVSKGEDVDAEIWEFDLVEDGCVQIKHVPSVSVFYNKQSDKVEVYKGFSNESHSHWKVITHKKGIILKNKETNRDLTIWSNGRIATTPKRHSHTFWKFDFLDNDEGINDWTECPLLSKYSETISETYSYLHTIEDLIKLRNQPGRFGTFVDQIGMNQQDREDLDTFLDTKDFLFVEEKAHSIEQYLKTMHVLEQQTSLLGLKCSELENELQSLRENESKPMKEQALPTEPSPVVQELSSASENQPDGDTKKLLKKSAKKVKQLNKKLTKAQTQLSEAKAESGRLEIELHQVKTNKEQKELSLSESLSDFLGIDFEAAQRHAVALIGWGIRNVDDLCNINLTAFRRILTDLRELQNEERHKLFLHWSKHQRKPDGFHVLLTIPHLEGDILRYDEALFILGLHFNDGVLKASSDTLGQFFKLAEVSEHDQEIFQKHCVGGSSDGATPTADPDLETSFETLSVSEWLGSLKDIKKQFIIKEQYINLYSNIFLDENCRTAGDIMELYRTSPDSFKAILAQFLGGYRPVIRKSIMDNIKSSGRDQEQKWEEPVEDLPKRSRQRIDSFLKRLIPLGLDKANVKDYCESFSLYNVSSIQDLLNLQPKTRTIVLDGSVQNQTDRSLIKENLPRG